MRDLFFGESGHRDVKVQTQLEDVVGKCFIKNTLEWCKEPINGKHILILMDDNYVGIIRNSVVQPNKYIVFLMAYIGYNLINGYK